MKTQNHPEFAPTLPNAQVEHAATSGNATGYSLPREIIEVIAILLVTFIISTALNLFINSRESENPREDYSKQLQTLEQEFHNNLANNLMVVYLDIENDRLLCDPYLTYITPGAPYSFNAPAITGYNCDQPVINGVMSETMTYTTRYVYYRRIR